MRKHCNKCNTDKPLDGFAKCKSKRDGRRSTCSDCDRQWRHANKEAISERNKQHYQANKEVVAERGRKNRKANKEAIAEQKKQYYEANKKAIVERTKQYQQANKEAIADYQKQYYQTNKNVYAERGRKYYHANKETIVERSKQYYQINKDVIIEKSGQYAKKRRTTDPLFRLRGNISRLIRHSIVKGGYTKTSKTHKILGCSYEEFNKHIEAQFTDGMSWDRMSGIHGIHIDHRLPVSAASTEAELLVLNHHRNLQPMWAEDNIAKSDSYCPKELADYFAKYL